MPMKPDTITRYCLIRSASNAFISSLTACSYSLAWLKLLLLLEEKVDTAVGEEDVEDEDSATFAFSGNLSSIQHLLFLLYHIRLPSMMQRLFSSWVGGLNFKGGSFLVFL